MKTQIKLRDILIDWADEDIQNVLHVAPDLLCTLQTETPRYSIFDTPNGLLAVGPGVGESGASFDSREIELLTSD